MQLENDTLIQFSGLKLGKYNYHYQLDERFFERFENEDLREGMVDFQVCMEKNDRMLLFRFSYHGKIRTTCDRCLGELDVPVRGEETLCVKFSDTETSENEDVVILPEGSHQIDIAQWMYEYVAVAMPIQKVHPEGGCDPEMVKYITEERPLDNEDEVRENTSGETDPRWEALKQLMEK